MKKIFTLLMLALFVQGLIAQQPCGINHDDIELITQRLLENKQVLKDGFINERDGETIYLPIKFHLIGKSDGTSRIGEDDVLRQLALLNADYLDQDIQFYIDSGFNYIDNTATFENPSIGAGLLTLGSNRLNGRINIFIPLTAMTGGGSIGTTLGFYSPFNDWIVVRQRELTSLTSTLTHEMGHFLSLLHPHNGWDAIVYDPAIHTPTPSTAPSGTVETENEDRTGSCSNCDSSGDFLCDTPPDYNFGFGWPDCDYDLGTLDPCGVLVDVQETNFMGYFGSCPNYNFTEQQKQLMEVDVANRISVNSIFGNLSPETIVPVEGNITANFPENGGVSFQAQSVYFNWEGVTGATDYIFQVARAVTGFSTNTQVLLENGQNDVTIEGGFLPNVDYIWRVYPYNQSSTDFDWSETFTFTTGEVTSVAEITEISSFDLYPNIISSQNEVLLDITSMESFDVNIQLLNLGGSVIETKATDIIAGSNKINFNFGELGAGVYFVNLTSDKGVLTKKLIVQ